MNATSNSSSTRATCASTSRTCPRSATSGGPLLEDVALCLNSGSSSLKFALFRVTALTEEALAVGLVEQVGAPVARATLTVAGKKFELACGNASLPDALDVAFQLLEEQALPQ